MYTHPGILIDTNGNTQDAFQKRIVKPGKLNKAKNEMLGKIKAKVIIKLIRLIIAESPHLIRDSILETTCKLK